MRRTERRTIGSSSTTSNVDPSGRLRSVELDSKSAMRATVSMVISGEVYS